MTFQMPAFATHQFINGALRPGEGPAETVLNPSTGTGLTEVAEASSAQVNAAVAAAAEAFGSWSVTTPKARSAPLVPSTRSAPRARRSARWPVCRSR